VVRVDEPAYPGFCRVILKRHAREMTDLDAAERDRLMSVVWKVEEAAREAMSPDKMNVASLGNMTPHVHWHVIPRFSDDRHFPGPIWAPPRREASVPAEREARGRDVSAAIIARLDR
jgi:diadenosine tetraphosphate (Ap4A) HIT family hydrolase